MAASGIRWRRERRTTKWWWRLDSGNSWDSRLIVASEAMPGVEFAIARMTFGRRLELMKRVRDLAVRIEYFEAGRDEKNRMEASLVGAEMDKLYLAWGLEEVRGLSLDGEAATPARWWNGGRKRWYMKRWRRSKLSAV